VVAVAQLDNSAFGRIDHAKRAIGDRLEDGRQISLGRRDGLLRGDHRFKSSSFRQCNTLFGIATLQQLFAFSERTSQVELGHDLSRKSPQAVPLRLCQALLSRGMVDDAKRSEHVAFNSGERRSSIEAKMGFTCHE
jgi:hypothetical protein